MSLRAISETSIYLDAFRNIDLCQQGYYYFKLLLFYEKDGLKVISHPYSFFKVHVPKSKGQPQNSRLKTFSKLHFLRKSDVNQEDNVFQSQIFYIRYTDEQVNLAEMVNFRTEVEAKVDYSHEHLPFTLEASLFFAEASEGEIKNPRNIPDYLDEQKMAQLAFKCVSHRKFKINSMLKGISEYFPLAFSHTHYSSINMIIHSSMMDFKFRQQSLGVVVKSSQGRSMESGIKVQFTGGTVAPKEKRQVESLPEFLFADDKESEERVGYLPIEVEKKEIERVYHIFIQSLINVYEKLRKQHNKYLKHASSLDKLALAEIAPLMIKHEFCKEQEPLSELNELSSANRLRKMNSTSFPKKKSEMESRSAHKENHVIPQRPLPKDPKKILKGKGAVPGLQFNCMDNICTKSYLDSKIQANSSVLDDSKAERAWKNSFRKVVASTPNEEYQDFNSSQVLDESQFLNHKLRSLKLDINDKIQFKKEALSDYLPLNFDSEGSPHAADIYESLPQNLTKTILKNSIKSPPIFFNQRSITPVRSFDRGVISNKLHAYQSGETKSIEDFKRVQKPLQANVKAKISSPINNKQILTKIKQDISKHSSQLSSFRSYSQNMRPSITPSPVVCPEEKNLSQSPLGDQNDEQSIQIPSIKINKRNLHMMNAQKSFIGIFQEEIKAQRDPHYVTGVVDQEIKQIGMQLFKAWHKMIGFISQDSTTTVEILKEKYIAKLQIQSQLYVISDENINSEQESDKLPFPEKNHKKSVPTGDVSPLTRMRKLSGQMKSKLSIDVEAKNNFGAPNSPSKIRNCLNMVEKRRFTTMSYKELKAPLIIEPLLSHPQKTLYDPIIFEEKFYNEGMTRADTFSDKHNRDAERLTKNFSQQKGSLQDTRSVGLGDQVKLGSKQMFQLSKSSSQIEVERKQLEKLHLFVFVHGFQASSYDMRTFKNYVSLFLPDAICLCSTANEEVTDGNIGQMGKNLAIEVKKHIQDWCYSRDGKFFLLQKITFVGHSLGGIIIRSALMHLQQFRKFFHSYISLGTPHLGYMYNTNSLINAGMWVLKRLKKSQCLQQLSMTDNPDKRKTFLYKLSRDEGMQSFKHVFFVSSYQDSYAPHDSARVQVCSRAAHADQSRGNLYTQMADGILSNLRCEQLVRLDVNFRIGMNLDSFIGRTAHMLLLESEQFVQTFINKYSEVFEE